MKQLEISDYRKVNESYHRRLIYHAGIDCGYFVELNYMINAMLYCLEHGLRFQIYFDALSSAGHPPRGLSTSQFSVLSLSPRAHKHSPRGLPGEGWTEFFLPFCTEVHEPFHRRYNFHRPPSWRRIIRNTLRERSFRFVVWKLKTMLLTLRSGDVLVIDSFSRLSRSTKDLLDLVEQLTDMGVHLISLKENLDTTTATGKLMLTMLSALSQFERDLIAERTIDGLKAARARGRQGGRPVVGTDKDRKQALAMYHANAMSNREIAERFGVSQSTLSRWIKAEKQG